MNQRPDSYRLDETSISVRGVFAGAPIPGLASDAEVVAALGRLHNILAELAALHLALRRVQLDTTLTVVHDFEGVAAWMQGRWKRQDPVVAAVIEACHELIVERQLRVSYMHQRGHQSSWAGRDDYARWNARADALVTEAGR